MTSDKVLLINLSPADIKQMEAIAAEFGGDEETGREIHCRPLDSIEEALMQAPAGNVVMVVMLVEVERKKCERDIRRLKRAFSYHVPVLLLVPPELTRKIKDCVRAGADDYWILPIEPKSFAPRLQVLLELAMGVFEGRTQTLSHRHVASSGGMWWQRLKSSLLRFFFGRPSNAVSPEDGLSLLSGKWRRIKRLGFGSFGEVSLVQQEGEGALAVSKVPHDPKLNTKFLREAAILKQLAGHPHAVQLIEVVKEEDRVVLIQEYVEGATLHELMSEGMDARAKEKAFLQLLDIVAHAHEKNIMHRDIKPENIIITPAGNLKLLDFGTSKDLTRGSVSKTVIGSRPYMAPEQIMGKSRIASDVWALGVVLYSLATEFLPFYDENEKQLMDAILETEPERPRDLEPGVPEELEKVILKCLRKDWSERYPNAVELRRDLLAKFPNFGAGEVLPQE